MVMAATLVGGLAGCAGCPPIQAAWYRVDIEEGKSTTLLMAIVSERKVELQELKVNTDDQGRGGGWSWQALPGAPPVKLQPGKVQLFDLGKFKYAGEEASPKCWLPLTVTYRCSAHHEPAWAKIEGRLPNYLPVDWVKDCVLP